MRKRKRAVELGFKPKPRTSKPLTRDQLDVMYANMGKEFSVPMAQVKSEMGKDNSFAYLPSMGANIVKLTPLSA